MTSKIFLSTSEKKRDRVASTTCRPHMHDRVLQCDVALLIHLVISGVSADTHLRVSVKDFPCVLLCSCHLSMHPLPSYTHANNQQTALRVTRQTSLCPFEHLCVFLASIWVCCFTLVCTCKMCHHQLLLCNLTRNKQIKHFVNIPFLRLIFNEWSSASTKQTLY